MFPSDVKLLKIFSYDNSDTVTFIALQRLITSQLDSLSVETRPDLRLKKPKKKQTHQHLSNVQNTGVLFHHTELDPSNLLQLNILPLLALQIPSSH